MDEDEDKGLVHQSFVNLTPWGQGDILSLVGELALSASMPHLAFH